MRGDQASLSVTYSDVSSLIFSALVETFDGLFESGLEAGAGLEKPRRRAVGFDGGFGFEAELLAQAQPEGGFEFFGGDQLGRVTGHGSPRWRIRTSGASGDQRNSSRREINP